MSNPDPSDTLSVSQTSTLPRGDTSKLQFESKDNAETKESHNDHDATPTPTIQSSTTTVPTTTSDPPQPTILTTDTTPEPSAASQPQYEFPYPGRRVATYTRQIYHEKQNQQHCAVHSINNILQYSAFTNRHFDAFSKELSPDSWVNPHKSILGTGNYDANVLLFALAMKSGLETTWYNRQKRMSFDRLDTTKLAGIIVNIITSSFLWWEQRHWIPLVPVFSADPDQYGRFVPPHPTPADQQRLAPLENAKPKWFNLNPLNDKPDMIIPADYLSRAMKNDKDCIVIFVLLPGVESQDIWMPEPDTNK